MRAIFLMFIACLMSLATAQGQLLQPKFVSSTQLDLGISNHIAPVPVGNKIKIKVRPMTAVVDGYYTEGKFTLRCPDGLGITLNILENPYGFEQFGAPASDGTFTYYVFSNILNAPYIVNWPANTETDLLTLGYNCTGNVAFELINNSFAQSLNGEYYQELDALDQSGIFYQTIATSAPAPAITASVAATPLCGGAVLDLGSTPVGGSGTVTYSWSGPDGFSAAVADPAAFSSETADSGTYTVSMSDDNGCTATDDVAVIVYPVPVATFSPPSDTIILGNATNLNLTFTGNAPWSYSLNGVVQPPVNTSPLVLTVAPEFNTTYSVTALSDAHCSGAPGSSSTVVVRRVLIDIGVFDHAETMPAGNKIKVKIKPFLDVSNGYYSEGKFTLRVPVSAALNFTVLATDYGFEQIGAPIDNGGYRYYIFSNVLNGGYNVNWIANTEIDILTLGYDCSTAATVELVNDAFAMSVNGEYYQELNAYDETGNFYHPQAGTSSVVLSATASSNSPFCAGGLLDLGSSISGGSGSLVYAWSGPDGYSAMLADPAPFATTNASNGLYGLTVTDANGCTAAASTNVVIYEAPTLSITQPAPACLSINLENVLKGEMPAGGTFSYHASLADAQANINPLAGAQVTAATTGIYGLRYTIAPNNCFATATITVTTDACVEVDTKIFLQGPYNATTNTMEANLKNITTPPLFPLTEPYSQYNTPAFNFAYVPVGPGGETTTAGVLANNDPNDAIVDWVFLELRNKTNLAQVLYTRSALLQRDGDVVDVDGFSPVLFAQAPKDQYYLMLRHRNHQGILSATPIDFSTSMPFIDFTDSATPTFGVTSTSARKELEPGVWGMLAGNTNLKRNGLNFQVKYNGTQNDRVEILNLVGPTTPLNTVNGYYLEDVNLNGQVKYNGAQNDRVIILNNVGPSTPLNVLTQEPPN